MAPILALQSPNSALWPPSPGAILDPCAALSLYCTPGRRCPARPGPNTLWTHNQRRGIEVEGGNDGKERNPQRLDSITRPWQACRAFTYTAPWLYANRCAHTPALIHQWGLTHIKVRWGWLVWVIGILWGDGEMLKTQAWKICCVRGSVKRMGGAKGEYLRFHEKEGGAEGR